ncbi:hypothetical protein HYU91_04590 [Candidatus Collierbacteria bacterium]|nr:hypothetical protein [Candidatus Collierbacteria bacterium]
MASERWDDAKEQLITGLQKVDRNIYRTLFLRGHLSFEPAVIQEVDGVEGRPRMRRVSLPFTVDKEAYPAVNNSKVSRKFPTFPRVTLTYFDGNPTMAGDEVVVVQTHGDFEGINVGVSPVLEKGVVWSIFLPARVVEQVQITADATSLEAGGSVTVDAKSGRRLLGLKELNSVPVEEALKAQADATAYDIAAHFVEVLDRSSSPGIKVSIEDMVTAITLLTEGNPILAMRWETLRDRLEVARYAMMYPDLVSLVFQSLVDLSGGEDGNSAFVKFTDDLRYGKAHTWSQIMHRINSIPQVRIPRGGLVDLTYRGLFTQPTMSQRETDQNGFTNVPASVLLAGPGLRAIRGRLEYYLSEGFQQALDQISNAAQDRQKAALKVMYTRIKAEEAGLNKIAEQMAVVQRKVRRQVVAGMENVASAMTLQLLADLVGMDVPAEDVEKLIGAGAIQQAMRKADLTAGGTPAALKAARR